jgi:hypothetical protein
MALQAHLRGAIGRKVYRDTRAKINVANKLKRAVIGLQCTIRMHSARAQLRELRREARDVGNLKGLLEEMKASNERLEEALQVLILYSYCTRTVLT